MSGVSGVRWNGEDRTTTFVSATQLTTAITAGDIAAPGTASVTVQNPGGASTLLNGLVAYWTLNETSGNRPSSVGSFVFPVDTALDYHLRYKHDCPPALEAASAKVRGNAEPGPIRREQI